MEKLAFTCGVRYAKGTLITFNFIFWISGCALIVFGIFILVEPEKTTLFPLFRGAAAYSDIQYLTIGVIGIGILVFIVGFLGCFGALRENKCMLTVYLVFLGIICVLEVLVGIVAMKYTHKIDSELEGHLQQTLEKEYGVDEQITNALDYAQTKYRCCGITDSSDYTNSTWKKNQDSSKTVTPSCCTLRNADENTAYLNPQPMNETLCQKEQIRDIRFRHQMSCLEKLKEFIKQEGLLFMSIGCGIACLEVLGVIVSIWMCQEI